ncbi:MAG: UMP kinase [Thermoplasmataceae archaeon]
MESLVISLGGSIVYGDSLNMNFLKKFSEVIEKLETYDRIGIVVGGGRLARMYIGELKKFNVNDNVLDEIGINATRMNALAAASFLTNVNTKIPTTVNDAAELSHFYRHVVMGGTEPGHTTDTVSVLLAERIGAREVINATSVDGVYSSDPKKIPDARKFRKLDYDKAIELSIYASIGAGPNVFMDITSLNIAKRSGIRIHVVNGLNLEVYGTIARGADHDGTVIAHFPEKK